MTVTENKSKLTSLACDSSKKNNSSNNREHTIDITSKTHKRVMVAMSGGVDSSVVCSRLCEAGYNVCGATMLLREGLETGAHFDKNEPMKQPENVHRIATQLQPADTRFAKTPSQSADMRDVTIQSQSIDVSDARSVCKKLGIEHHVLDFTDRFKHDVVEPFCMAYMTGTTPNPCVICNQQLKFKALHEAREAEGCDFLATGHYARISRDDKTGRYLLKTATDPRKNQSYVLYGLTQKQLAHTLFPLGGQSKSTTREIARERDLSVADKAESQDICFIPDGDYVSFIKRYTAEPRTIEDAKIYNRDFMASDSKTNNEINNKVNNGINIDTKKSESIFKQAELAIKPGPIVLSDGTSVGSHKGLLHYTPGQRHGIGVAWSEPLYVLHKDVKDNTLVVGTANEMGVSELWAQDVNLISVDKLDVPSHVEVKVNYRARRAPATARVLETGELHVMFDKPIRTCAPGQACVMYEGDNVVGGGIISRYSVSKSESDLL